MKKFCLLVLVFLVKISSAQYVAGGEIKYTCLGGNQYQVNVTIWGENLNSTDTLFLFWGDNTSSSLTQVSLISLASALPANYSNYIQASWQGTHYYPGPDSYKISAVYNTRRAGIANIPNSAGSVFYLACDIELDPSIGCNSSPVFTNAQYILFDSMGNPFVNPVNVSDPDGDSLSFVLQPCDVPGYTYPNIIAGGNFSVDGNTGTTSWSSPQQTGIYNYVLRTIQLKHIGNGVLVVGYADMEIEIDVSSVSGIIENGPFLFSISPMPANDFLYLNTTDKISFEITTIAGQDVSSGSCSGKIDIQSLSDGVYFLHLFAGEGKIYSQKFIVRH